MTDTSLPPPRTHTGAIAELPPYLRAQLRRRLRARRKIAYINGRRHWLWTGHRNSKGYGVISIVWHRRKYAIYVHRASYMAFKGPLKNNSLHICDIPACFRPRCLYDGTQSDNMIDRAKRGHAGATLTPAQVITIRARRAQGEPYRAIAADYNVHLSTIFAACTGSSWAWFTPKEGTIH